MENVVQVTPDTFQSEVIEKSNQQPVLVLFWADQVPPSVQTRQMVEGLVGQYAGKVTLALSDVAMDQTLAQHLRVQGLPSLRVIHQGKIVEQIDGPADEDALRTLLDGLTQSPADMLKAQMQQLIDTEQWDVAISMLQQAVNDEPANQAFRVELADVLVRKGDLDDARTVLASIPEDTPERSRPQNRLEFVEEAAGLGSLAEAQAEVAADENNLDAHYRMSILLVIEGEMEAALEASLHILRADRAFRDDIGRLTMIRIFELLGKGHELAGRYRRKMFNFMH